MFGELQIKHCIILLVVLAFCAVTLTVFPLVNGIDDGSAAHANRKSHELHKQMVQATLSWRTAKLHGLGQRIPVLTVDTRSDEAFVPMNGAEGLTMSNVGVHGDWSSMLSKNEMILDWLEDQVAGHHDDLVIIVDSNDMLYGGCEIDVLLSGYKRVAAASGGALIVASAELGLSPQEPKYEPQRYENLRKRQLEVMNASGLNDDPWHIRNQTRQKCKEGINATGIYACSNQTGYEFMNYGFLMGPVGAMHTLVSHVVKTVQPNFFETMKGFLSQDKHMEELNDQGVAAMYMFDHPDEVTLDYPMSLIASLHDMPHDLLDVDNGKMRNAYTKRHQCFMHFNGNSQHLFHSTKDTLLESIRSKKEAALSS
jgi:hypothetical protein